YFGVPVESLDVLQGATLAAMIPAPNEINPFKAPDLVLERRNRVLRDMVETHHLTPDAAAALATRPLVVRHGLPPSERFPSYTGFVAQVVDRSISRRAAATFGLSIFTRLDIAWQQQAEQELAGGLAAL